MRMMKSGMIGLLALLATTSVDVGAEEIVRDSLFIDKVVVTGSRNEISLQHLPMNLTVIEGEEIDNRYEQSLLPLLSEQTPGLFITSRGVMGYGVSTGGSGGVTMRGIGGAPTTGVLVLVDGHPQYMGIMGHTTADSYQSLLARKVEVVRGPVSLLYGSNAMGGVINILTDQHKKDGFENSVDLSYGSYQSLTSELSSRYKSGRFSALVTASYNRSDGHRDNMEFQQYGGYAKVAYQFSKRWSGFVDMNLSHYDASNPGMEMKPIYDNDSHITRGISSLSIENRYAKSSGAIKLFYNWGHHNINDGYFMGEDPKNYLFDSRDQMLGATIYQTYSFFSGNNVTAGVDYQRFGGVVNNLYNDGSEKLIIDKNLDNIAGYIDFRQSFSDFLTVNGGVRIDNHTISGTAIIPQFGASLYPIENGEIKAIASRGFRNPTIREMYMFPPQNPDLKAESIWSYDLSWINRLLDGRLSYQATLYYIDGKNLIQTQFIDGKPLNVNSAEVRNWGVELSGNYQLSRVLSVVANYSYLNMENPILAAPKHKLYGAINLASGRFSSTISAQYIGDLYTSTSGETPTIESYTNLGARASYAVTDSFKVYVKGENLLGEDYEINLGFPMPKTTLYFGVRANF